ncbi:MAG: PD-(D/E)XK nuclease family protein [Gemmatimonadetes bacterium]|nr:PD-(D/E)XK nuclease family protein [Gemmatimonadota bacterium]
MDGWRWPRQRECVRLLQELTPHLQAARLVERELDRHLARRFNTFRYLRSDELGLSEIIADLLDPDGEHCQGTTFLESMLELLEVAPEAPDSGRTRHSASGRGSRPATLERLAGRLRSTAPDKIRVVLERGLPGRRRIDITVDIATDDGRFCLAFENKPYADDQPRQCRDYLKFLDQEYRGRFLLVYLPPRYRMPDKSSLPDLEPWKNHFRVLPYVADDAPLVLDDSSGGEGAALGQAASAEDVGFAEDAATDHNATAGHADAAVGDGASLADWFGTCCKLSDAERLRWFLREAQLFCQHHFGDSTMTDTEARYIREYLEENPRHLHAAFAVRRAWPAVKHDVCRRFLEHLRDRVEERARNEFPKIVDDLNIGCHYGGDKNWSNYLRVYRYGWVQDEGVRDPRSDGRTAVMLECGKGGPTSWGWGVRAAKSQRNMTDAEKKHRQEVEAGLNRNGLSRPDAHHWPHHERPRYQNWSVIVPQLAQELADGGGKITDHYVNGLLRIAEKAIPAIDEVELENKGSFSSKDS